MIIESGPEQFLNDGYKNRFYSRSVLKTEIYFWKKVVEGLGEEKFL